MGATDFSCSNVEGQFQPRRQIMSGEPLKKLDDGQVEEVVGGYIFDSTELTGWPPGPQPWEVLDDKGDVVARFHHPGEAADFAAANGYSTEHLDWSQVQKLRNSGSPN
jgi:hypothetical protein